MPTGWNGKGVGDPTSTEEGCPDVEEGGASAGELGGESHVEEVSTGGDGFPDAEEQVAPTGGLVVLWMSQHEEDLIELVGVSTVEVQWTLLHGFFQDHHCVCVCLYACIDAVCVLCICTFLEDVQFVFTSYL